MEADIWTADTGEQSPRLHLSDLPDELVDLVLQSLPRSALCSLSVSSRWGYSHAAGMIWKEVRLIDQKSTRTVPRRLSTDARRMPKWDEVDENGTSLAKSWVAAQAPIEMTDDHDETRIFQKLFVLATNPYVASKVQTILHRCHLPSPELFQELPYLLHDDCISGGPDLSGGDNHRSSTFVRLVLQAVANMTSVHTLKVVLGHSGITQTLLWGFFGPHRKGNVPVRKLWLESCCIRSQAFERTWTPMDFSSLESLRLRRLWFQDGRRFTTQPEQIYRYARSEERRQLRNPNAGWYTASVASGVLESEEASMQAKFLTERSLDSLLSHDPHDPKPSEELKVRYRAPPLSYLRFVRSLTHLSEHSKEIPLSAYQHLQSAYNLVSLDGVLDLLSCRDLFDVSTAIRIAGVWQPTLVENGLQIRDTWVEDPLVQLRHGQLENVLFRSSQCLTSLTLDWVLFCQGEAGSDEAESAPQSKRVMARLCSLVCPNLRAFQVRNCIADDTQLHEDVYLFGEPFSGNKGFIDFLEAHPTIRCLAWPMDRFFTPDGPASRSLDRVRALITDLGRSLLDLRVDVCLSSFGEPQTDTETSVEAARQRKSRRRFISEFAAEMRALLSIKMEGGIPRDEKRETIRALSGSPLQKLVLIGASFPLANTWGFNGRYLSDIHEAAPTYVAVLEDEDEDLVHASTSWTLSSQSQSSQNASEDDSESFKPMYGWANSSIGPTLHCLASLHADSIRELKFCGYIGAPMLEQSSPVTHPLLHHLRHFPNLRELVMSFWLLTFYDDEHRDEEIISYWLDMRKPSSTALAIIPPPQTLSRSVSAPNLQAFAAAAAGGPSYLNEPAPNAVANILPTLQGNDQPEVNPIHEAAAAAPTPEIPSAAQWLYENYHPSNLAKRVTKFIGQHLHPDAKAREDGMRVRASFCLGNDVQDIFDFDVRIGIVDGEDTVLSYVGPREDGWDEGARGEEKLRARRWF